MADPGASIHSTASVHPGAQVGPGVKIGPYSCIGEKVSIGKNTVLESHVVLTGWTSIGENCRFSPFSTVGTEPQDVSYTGEETRVRIGDNNVFREYTTVHRGTSRGRGETVIGNGNYFMAFSHVAHDCVVGNETILTHGATLGGHVTVEDFANISAFSAVHQFCRIGKFAFIGGYSVITQDVLPFSRVVGSRPTLLYGVNTVGLRRKGFSRERIRALKEMFRILFYSGLNTSQAVAKIEEAFPSGEDREEILGFIRASNRGLVKKISGPWNED